jgi:hypothetical protein
MSGTGAPQQVADDEDGPETYGPSSELFYEDDNGLRQDGDLHEALLGEAEDADIDDVRKQAVKDGMAQDVADTLYA